MEGIMGVGFKGLGIRVYFVGWGVYGNRDRNRSRLGNEAIADMSWCFVISEIVVMLE
jgi:hypothetical protein